ncbi:MAG: hypothetical protein EOO96_10500 [Pedobacter sp.]|nr:MAG: hypothetical protein EOO96_10500 [Pedobacter sp.]
MENKHYSTLTKLGINCFKYSLITGTILYASYIVTQNSDLFYWGFMRFFPEQGSRIDHPELGEDIVAANDQRKLAASKA